MRNSRKAPEVIEWNPGEANPKQLLFFQSRTLYTAYGGAKGGGKTWAVRVKAVGGALVNPGIRILIMRKTYPELEENHIRPILALVPPEAATYNGTSHLMTFANGSTIKFGHWADEASEREYQGLEYDWIFIDEATQFSERSFNYLGGCLRGISKYPKRMYLTCNPGGVGHRWVKRLFIDRQYKLDGDPEERENPEDYTFIPATVEDNTALLESSPGYLRMLAQMPEDLKKAYRYGDWDAIGGNYFPEFSVKTHVRKSFEIPKNWVRYRSFDYGLDMLAVYWWAVDQDGRSWCYREFCQKGLIVQEAAQKIKDLTHEPIAATYAPPDMWNRQKDTGRSMAEIYMENGIGLVRASNNRVQGHMLMKEALALKKVKDPYVKELFQTDTLPGMMFFENCKNIINDIRDIQHDDNDPNDCAKEPHDITHTVDGVRYYAISRVLSAEPEDEEEYVDPYEEYMTGGEITEGYLAC